MRERSAAVFCMAETGHFQRLRSLVRGLAGVGIEAHVFTHAKFAREVRQACGVFHDLFAEHPLEEADDASLPVPCRFVTFAAHYADALCRKAAKIRPSLVVHDAFAVIGRVVATRLDVPRVNVCAGHNVQPERFLAVLRDDPRVKVAPCCLRAADVLRESYGMADASPFSYVSSLSPDLNIHCEPPEFLDAADQRVFEPVAFYGSLPSFEGRTNRRRTDRSRLGAAPLRVYGSFGTVPWRYYAAEACRALTVLADAFAETDHLHAVISLGSTGSSHILPADLTRPNVRVEDYVDQWGVLGEADVFVTHHGMNSTHEAISQRVPMISYPFFWDQPGLAAKCREFGLAVPLTDSPRGAFCRETVRAALNRLAEERDRMGAALARARGWEEATIRKRPAVLQRIAELIA